MEANQFYFITFESIALLSIQLDKKIDFFRLHKQHYLKPLTFFVPLLNWPMERGIRKVCCAPAATAAARIPQPMDTMRVWPT